jgi:hypothetical protein
MADQKKIEPAANRDKKPRKILPPAPQKPNYQIWILGLVLVALFAISYFGTKNSTEEIDRFKFSEMVKAGDVKKVVFVKNEDIVEITLTESAVNNKKYQNTDGRPDMLSSKSKGPQFRFTVESGETFKKDYRNTASYKRLIWENKWSTLLDLPEPLLQKNKASHTHTEQEHIPLDQQRLMYGGVELESDRTLSEYNVHQGSELQLVLTLDSS